MHSLESRGAKTDICQGAFLTALKGYGSEINP